MSSARRPTRRLRRPAVLAIVLCVLILPGGLGPGRGGWGGSPAAARAVAASSDSRAAWPRWSWPVEPAPPAVVVPFAAPAHPYGPGHRGIDLAAAIGSIVRAPADGVVAFRGAVAGRSIVTIDHGNGLVTTFEPIDSPLTPGMIVRRADAVGTVSTGGHAAPGTVHFGVRHNGAYINPLLLLGEVRRAILLPCCE